MTLTKDQMKAAVLHLTPADRETLAEDLLLSISDEDRRAVDKTWLAEVRKRDLNDLILGANARPFEAVLEGLEKRLGK